MLFAKRKSDGQTESAYVESKSNEWFLCLECSEEVILKMGRARVNHLAPKQRCWREGLTCTARGKVLPRRNAPASP
jgi:competence CoiA-like predicted nuclease